MLKASTWPSSATASRRARRQAINALGVQRIHLYAALAQQAMQHAAVDDLDVVRRRVVDVDVGRLGRAMVATAFDLVHELVQRAAQRHVDLLQAAADREQGDAAVEAMADQGERGGVARWIVRGAFPALLATVVMRLDIGRAAGQQHAVQRIEQAVKRFDGRLFVAPKLGANRRDQDGQGADGMDGCPHILVANRVVPATAAVFLEAGRDSHEGAQRRAVHFPCRSVQKSAGYSLIWSRGLQMAACRACRSLCSAAPHGTARPQQRK